MDRCALADNPCGLTLARPVRNAAGTVLLERGVVLEERAIRRLLQLGVKQVYVERRRDGTAPSEAETAARQAIAEREARRFGDLGDDPWRAALLAAAVEIKAGDWESFATAAGAEPAATE